MDMLEKGEISEKCFKFCECIFKFKVLSNTLCGTMDPPMIYNLFKRDASLLPHTLR